jgi:heparanase
MFGANPQQIWLVAGIVAALAAAGCAGPPGNVPATTIAPSTMARVGSVDERFQSYNVEMVEVTGGEFWQPYAALDAAPAGSQPQLFQYRPPINLGHRRLLALAAALGPAYMRVSGTWANTTWFHNANSPPPSQPPRGFGGVLTRGQWQGAIAFARAANAELAVSFATGVGTRDARGVWTPREARKLVSYTGQIGGRIAAAEFMNEPNYAEMGGAPRAYDAAAYGRDMAVFVRFLKQAAPRTLVLGPGSSGEGLVPEPAAPIPGILRSQDLLAAAGTPLDAFSYHFYGAVSERCARTMPHAGTSAEAALSAEWLSRTERAAGFYAGLRDRFAPGKPLWVTETAEAACGGNRWAATFLDSFRYLDQLGRLARRGVQIVMHNTLAASDYGLLDEATFAPRPNYWAALLWRRLMGTTVLDASVAGPNIYAHCLRNSAGGIAVLVLNLDRAFPQTFDLAARAQRYTLTAVQLTDTAVQLNGAPLQLGLDDSLPTLTVVTAGPGRLDVPPASISFLAFPDARNPACA